MYIFVNISRIIGINSHKDSNTVINISQLICNLLFIGDQVQLTREFAKDAWIGMKIAEEAWTTMA